jgi:hypothetical protein
MMLRARGVARAAAAIGIAAVLLGASGAKAQTLWNNPGTGDWFNAANWTAGVPTSSKNAYIDNGGTAQIAASDAKGLTYVGYTTNTGVGAVIQTGGTNTSITLGYNSGSQGTYTLSGGSLGSLSGDTACLGYSGTGTFIQTGGMHTTIFLSLGYNSQGSGTYTLSNGSLSVERSIVGFNGTGTFVQTGGTHAVALTLVLGETTSMGGGGGTYTLSGGVLSVGTSTAVAENILPWPVASAPGLFTQTGGKHTVGQTLPIGLNGTYVLSGGELTVPQMSVSQGGRFEAKGGQFDVTDSFSVSGDVLVAGCTQSIQGSLTVSDTGTLKIDTGSLSARTIDLHGPLTLVGGTLGATAVSLVGTAARVEGSGAVAARVTGDVYSQIKASGGALALGDANSWNGFSTAGGIQVGSQTVTLHSRAFATLGNMTELAGGTFGAPNGVYLPGGGNLVGAGQVSARLSAAIGSSIVATGNLAIGDANAYDGFFSDGSLVVGANTVTIYDRNEAVLGSLTAVGDAGGPGTLTGANGLLLEQGKNLVGYGKINGDFINQGYVKGEGPAPEDLLELTGHVKGIGNYGGNIMFSGTYSPGNSPAAVGFEGDAAFGSESALLMELAGESRGAQYDALLVSGLLTLDGALDVELLYGYMPSYGATFDLLDWGNLASKFDAVDLPALGGGLTWDTSGLYTTGTITVAPEPATLALVVMGVAGTLLRRRRR